MARGVAGISVAIHISREKYMRIFGHAPEDRPKGSKNVKGGSLPDLGEVPCDYDPINNKRFFDGTLGKHYNSVQERLADMKARELEFGEPKSKWEGR